jgi:ribosomal protein S30
LAFGVAAAATSSSTVASRALRFLPFQRSLWGRDLIRCDSSHGEHTALYAVAQGTSLAKASRAVANHPKIRPWQSSAAQRSDRVSPLFLFAHFLSFLFQPRLPPCYHHSTGKVHGSLARAGKVRGQTPKVAKQDKKKLPKVRKKKKKKKKKRKKWAKKRENNNRRRQTERRHSPPLLPLVRDSKKHTPGPRDEAHQVQPPLR